MKTQIKYIIIILLSAIPSIAHCGPEFDTSFSILFMLGAVGVFLFVPFAAIQAEPVVGHIAWIQVPVILLAVAITRILLQKTNPRTRNPLIVLPILYVFFTFGSNSLYFSYIEKRLSFEKVIWNIPLGSTEEEIQKLIGLPKAGGRFTTTESLPEQIAAVFSNRQIKDMYLIVYEYKPKKQYKNNRYEMAYYLALDPSTHRLISRASVGGVGGFRGVVVGKWPYN